jgi:predicted Zn-dependent protease
MSKRLNVLEKMVSGGTKDSFAWYGLALEYINVGRLDDGLNTFTALRERDPQYVPMYLMCGTALSKAGRNSEAREWLSAGVDAARARGDTHALGELEVALAALPTS